MASGLLFIILQLATLVASEAEYAGRDGLEEYCQLETFSPRCRHGDVIVMTAARFGRMRIGKCIDGSARSTALQKVDPGSLGCYADVLEYTDRACSGMPACDISVPNRDLLRTRPCFAQLTMYFEASYKCVAVVDDDRSCTVSVTTGTRLHLLSQSNFGSRQVPRCGSRSSPWVLEAQTGQQINISLLDFAGGQRRTEVDKETVSSDVRRQSSGSVSDDCLVQYGYLVDKTGKKNVSICRTSPVQREKFIYQSTGNVLEIVLPMPTTNNSAFLVAFEAVGCSNLVPPADAWLRRTGNEATVGCYTTRKRWRLLCEGSHWRGTMGTCTNDEALPRSAEVKELEEEKESGFFEVLAIVTISFAGLAICLIIIFVGIGCARRYRQQNGSIDSVDLLIGANGEPGTDKQVKCRPGNSTTVPGLSSVYRTQSDDTKYRDAAPQYFVLDRDALTNENFVAVTR